MAGTKLAWDKLMVQTGYFFGARPKSSALDDWIAGIVGGALNARFQKRAACEAKRQAELRYNIELLMRNTDATTSR